MLSRWRAFTLAAASLCVAASPAAAQYNVFLYNGVRYTDVIVNRAPQTLAHVRAFENCCRTPAISGQWWMDGYGNLGRMG